MVATVFPIGIDISREAIQANLAPAVLESAATALRVKVPFYQEFDGDPARAAQRVLVPDTQKIELDATPNPCEITSEEWTVLDALLPPPSPPYPGQSYPDWGPGWSGLDVSFISHTRVFTERSGWANEDNQEDAEGEAYLIPVQNVPVDWVNRPEDKAIVTMACPTFGNSPPMLDYLPRIHLADQVYPPIMPRENDGTFRSPRDIAAEAAAQRRYSWVAFHHKMSSAASNRQDMLATIVVLHRADLNERYARQADSDPSTPAYDAYFDLNDPDAQELLLQPQPDDDPATDVLFPRPWLVMFDTVNLDTGEVICSGRVAQLLPAGSFFVVASAYDLVNNEKTNLPAGRYFEVLESSYDPDDLSAPATLRIARSGSGGGNNVLVWVFPPAIDRAAGTFSRKSPVAGVGMEVLAFTDN